MQEARALRALLARRRGCAVLALQDRLRAAPGRLRQRRARRSRPPRRAPSGPGGSSRRRTCAKENERVLRRSARPKAASWTAGDQQRRSVLASDSACGASLRTSSARECSRLHEVSQRPRLQLRGRVRRFSLNPRYYVSGSAGARPSCLFRLFFRDRGDRRPAFCTPAFSRILPSISFASAGFSLRKSRELSLPWPRRSPL